MERIECPSFVFRIGFNHIQYSNSPTSLTHHSCPTHIPIHVLIYPYFHTTGEPESICIDAGVVGVVIVPVAQVRVNGHVVVLGHQVARQPGRTGGAGGGTTVAVVAVPALGRVRDVVGDARDAGNERQQGYDRKRDCSGVHVGCFFVCVSVSIRRKNAHSCQR